ncbi:MAG TPA: enoyl-CoA hydratase-related protein [Acidimicrobiia bacterium]|nr:enoyl-CoA hydratase-related protein [Acidimicrobiia bacterium]
MDYEAIRIEDDNHVRVITLDRPERRNAMSWRMLGELAHAMAAADEDDDVRVVVLTGAPPALCAGTDMSADGHAIGVGLTYPLQCDVRFVAADAKLSFAFTRRGVAPELGSHFTLPRIVGFSNAADLLLSGRTFSGTEAAEMGLASRALPADEVLPAALDYAQEMARECSPTSCAIVKELLWSALDLDQAETRRIELALFGWIGKREDAAEGVASWAERRPPRWSGLPSERPRWWPAPPR